MFLQPPGQSRGVSHAVITPLFSSSRPVAPHAPQEPYGHWVSSEARWAPSSGCGAQVCLGLHTPRCIIYPYPRINSRPSEPLRSSVPSADPSPGRAHAAAVPELSPGGARAGRGRVRGEDRGGVRAVGRCRLGPALRAGRAPGAAPDAGREAQGNLRALVPAACRGRGWRVRGRRWESALGERLAETPAGQRPPAPTPQGQSNGTCNAPYFLPEGPRRRAGARASTCSLKDRCDSAPGGAQVPGDWPSGKCP